jgi:CHAD domain-containing protein
MRVALKGLRYTLELATIHFPDVFPEPLLEEARLWQGALGEIQDWHTLRTAARGFALHTPAAVAPAAHAALTLRCRQAIATVRRRRHRIAAFADRVAIQAANLHGPDEHATVSDAARQGGAAE